MVRERIKIDFYMEKLSESSKGDSYKSSGYLYRGESAEKTADFVGLPKQQATHGSNRGILRSTKD